MKTLYASTCMSIIFTISLRKHTVICDISYKYCTGTWSGGMHNKNVGEIDRSHNYLLNVSENRKVPND
jgi:hypothetical protein